MAELRRARSGEKLNRVFGETVQASERRTNRCDPGRSQDEREVEVPSQERPVVQVVRVLESMEPRAAVESMQQNSVSFVAKMSLYLSCFFVGFVFGVALAAVVFWKGTCRDR